MPSGYLGRSEQHYWQTRREYKRGMCASKLGFGSLQKMQCDSYRNASLERLKEFTAQLSDIEFCRARHVITEIDRTEKATTLASNGEWLELGELMYQSHHSLRNDYEVSCQELDFLVERFHRLGIERGVLGSRMTGGGFGGCTITLVKDSFFLSLIEMCLIGCGL